MSIVTIVGRPNVGKSSLFNRMIGKRASIVDDQPGVTRDRIYGEITIGEKNIYLVDTGGLLPGYTNEETEGIHRQVLLALEESDLLLFVIDGKEGFSPLDQDVALLLRKSGKPVIVVVNKVDDFVHEHRTAEGYRLGFDHVIGVSASHGRNIGEIFDIIETLLETQGAKDARESEISVALVGRPNVGKSTLLNLLTGSERSLVSSRPGTTRDSVDSYVTMGGRSFVLIDTAGLRKRSRIRENVEFYSLVRTQASIDRCDVAMLMMEGMEPCTDQDKKIAGRVIEKNKGLVIAVNKWDLLPKAPELGDVIRKKIQREMPFTDFAPVVFISSKSGRGAHKLPEVLEQTWLNRKRRLATSKLNELVRDILALEKLPTDGKGRMLRIYYCTQIGVEPPTFVFFVNDPEIATPAFQRHTARIIRRMENFEGSTIRIFWRSKK